MAHNEDTRVKLPAILHFQKLGYKYISLKGLKYDTKTHILTDIFKESVLRINKLQEDEKSQELIKKSLQDLFLLTEYEDLGKAFYQKITDSSELKLIDFSNFKNNSFSIATEFTFSNDDEEFRPDITVFINGIPLAFIEVKKPNNKEGIIAERNRINSRFKNKKFKRFFNMLQILVFSNNMEYDENQIEPLFGAFYATSAKDEARFNYFREELPQELLLEKQEIKDEEEDFVLFDNNHPALKHSKEFLENKKPDTPTNRVISSLFFKERLKFFLKYGIAYLEKEDGKVEKHIMRYPQFFASRAIAKTIENDIKKGIIWHTQGSGKTALAFYNIHHLTDLFSKQQKIPKFYFIVDRIDLLEQAKTEFSTRGIKVNLINSRDEFVEEFKKQSAISNSSGKPEITIINIQKFKEGDFEINNDYNLNIQRVYFIDEAHRSYNITGSFLPNLVNADRKAIMLSLTGTPIIGKTKGIFGNYIHTYYYNSSIKDGYTLRLIREAIENEYKIKLQNILEEIEVEKGLISKKDIYASKKFVAPLLEYILKDFNETRKRINDNSIGAMVICNSSEQAENLFEEFNNQNQNLISALILHDHETKQDRKDKIKDFKAGKIDILFVYNMLLTGFDAPRLKKLYLARFIKEHNLLQALTRVNRSYKNFKFGFVVDFVDIKNEFDATNKAYFEELKQDGFNEDEIKNYSELFLSKEEIEAKIDDAKEKLFHFNLENAEIFAKQLNEIKDAKQILNIKKALETIRNLYNLIRFFNYKGLLNKIDFAKFNLFFKEAQNRLDSLNLQEALKNNNEKINILNIALENLDFKFFKSGEEELRIADEFQENLSKTREELLSNFDKEDKEFITLYEELERIFKNGNFNEMSQEEMTRNIEDLQGIYKKCKELNRKNRLIKDKYLGDEKFARLHKRMVENNKISAAESKIHQAFSQIKTEIDEKVHKKQSILQNEALFKQDIDPNIINNFRNNQISIDAAILDLVNSQIAKEYIKSNNNENDSRFY